MVFLQAVAERFAQRGPLDRVCFVFPNRRSATFFKRYLGKAAGRPVFVPNVLTIDELFAKIAGIQESQQKARLLYILYQEYIKLMPGSPETGPEPFDQFIYWGDILLSDFDDLDKYLADVRRLLVNLHDLKALSTDYDFLTDDQKAAIAAFCNSFEIPGQARTRLEGANGGEGQARRKFAEIWDILYPLYTAFRERLATETDEDKRPLAYAGMIYRRVAESLPEARTLLPQFDEIVFVGLNALNACEKALLNHLKKEGRADFYWDFAGPMVTDPDNLAGRFLRDNINNYPPKQAFACPALDPQQQYYEVIRVPSAVGQTRKAMQILQQLQEKGELLHPEQTAVVLPDENLLFPMLGAVPEGIGKVNVTMGYSLSASSGAQIFQLLERLQANARQRNGRWGFYHRDVVDLLEHPYITATADPQQISALKLAIREENLIFVPAERLAAPGGICATVFQAIPRTDAIPAWLKAILEQVQPGQRPLEREFLYHYHEAVCELEGMGLPLETLEPRTWYRLLAQYIALVKIPFEGEPLSGLQIMGPLETRALDFDTVIMLSVGEGIFPSRSVSASFIPFNLRLGFGLPTYEQQDAMWSYYFYRGICRARRIYLLYDSRTEGLQSGEESRFIKQLRYLYEVPLVEKVATYALSSKGGQQELPRVEKDAAVLQELEDRFFIRHKTFSASALNAYLDCPLQFYYQYVKEIREQDEVVEDLDAGIFGTLYHRVMEWLYQPFLGGELRTEDLKALRNDRKHIERLLDNAFAEARITEISGENQILRDLIRHFVRRTLEVDATLSAQRPLWLQGLEDKVFSTLALADGRQVQLFGKIDRLDSQEAGLVRVVDYKSGNVKGKDDCEDVDKLFDRTLKKRPSIGFQLYFYALLKYRTASDPSQRFAPCIYSLRDIFSTELPGCYSIAPEQLDAFEQRLAALVAEVLDPATPFAATEREEICQYCNFKRLCNRQ